MKTVNEYVFLRNQLNVNSLRLLLVKSGCGFSLSNSTSLFQRKERKANLFAIGFWSKVSAHVIFFAYILSRPEFCNEFLSMKTKSSLSMLILQVCKGIISDIT
jgi:hypothetical protein